MLTREKRLRCRHNASPNSQHTRVNTSVGLSIWYFLVLWYLKSIYIIFTNVYIYYKKNTDGLWFCPSPALSEQDLMISSWLVKKNKLIHKLYFYETWSFYTVFTCILVSLIIFDSLVTQPGRFMFIFFLHWTCVTTTKLLISDEIFKWR